jgi:glycosyltransferase involved in cell wall biosynthesis
MATLGRAFKGAFWSTGLRLLFNATNLRSEGGVILLEQLVVGFLAYPSGAAPMHLLLYHNPELSQRIEAFVHALPKETQARIKRIPFREPDGLRRFYWEQVTLPHLINQRQVDVFCSFGNTGPLLPGCRQILYLQQSIPYSSYRPHRHALKWLKFKWLYGALINLAQLGSERIIVPTSWLVEPMRRAIGYRKPQTAYRVSLPGIPPWPKPTWDTPEKSPTATQTQSLLEQLAQARAAGDKILLYPCYLAPYKNIPALLQALQFLPADHPPFKLVLTFNVDSPEYFPCKAEALAAVASCPRKQIILAGALSRATLAQVYALTDILLFPSLVETLGLPLLEAMSLGIPIIALNGAITNDNGTVAAFAQEICQTVALYAPPHNPQALAEQIHRLLSDESLAQELSQNGLHRAAQCSWTDHVRQILETEDLG